MHAFTVLTYLLEIEDLLLLLQKLALVSVEGHVLLCAAASLLSMSLGSLFQDSVTEF